MTTILDECLVDDGFPQAERVVEFLLQVLNNEDSEKVQSLISMGFAKLMLSGMVTDERVSPQCRTLDFG